MAGIKSKRRFTADGQGVRAYVAGSEMFDEFRFTYRPMPQEAVDEYHGRTTRLRSDGQYRRLTAECHRLLAKHVYEWDFEEIGPGGQRHPLPINADSLSRLEILAVRRMEAIVLGVDAGDPDPEDRSDAPMTSEAREEFLGN